MTENRPAGQPELVIEMFQGASFPELSHFVIIVMIRLSSIDIKVRDAAEFDQVVIFQGASFHEVSNFVFSVQAMV